MIMIQAKELTKTYGKGDIAVTALDGVDFIVNKGELVAIQGPEYYAPNWASDTASLSHLYGKIEPPSR